MPQVGARISEEQELWLRRHFRSKSAGAEFLLPWAIAACAGAMAEVRARFTPEELKVVVDALEGTRILPEMAGTSYLRLAVCEACGRRGLCALHGADAGVLDGKLAALLEPQATALLVWASAYWHSPACAGASLDEYVAR